MTSDIMKKCCSRMVNVTLNEENTIEVWYCYCFCCRTYVCDKCSRTHPCRCFRMLIQKLS